MKAFSEQTGNIPIEVGGNDAYNIPATRNNIMSLPVLDREEMSGEKFGFYERTLNIKTSLPDKFTFVLPSMVVNGDTYPTLKIMFNKQSGAWLMPINC
jgi:hypothetical protein